MRYLLGGMASLLLAGCASGVQQQALSEQQGIVSYCRLLQDSVSGTVAANLAFEGQDATPAQMAISDRPSAPEREEMGRFAQAMNTCMDRKVAWISSYNPWRAGIASQVKQAKALALSDLIAGNISYGEANRRFMAIEAQMNAEYQSADGRQMAMDQAYQAQRTAAFAAALQGVANTASALTPPPQPIIINQAPQFPTNCRTVFIGNIARTQCF